ncbi:MAG TPA: epoxide hydrolase [Polyangia bacterium]|nr:epoxide hydrolase [Polyangia bacterium]
MEGEPFRIAVPEAELADLQTRLGRTRWARLGAGPGWTAGTDPTYLRGLVDYWRSGFDWRGREAELNALPHRTFEVGGGRLHFIHVPGRAPGGLPLLLLHGWPDSFLRFEKTIGPLSETHDLVIPSLPGFAFSGDLRAPGVEPPNRFSAGLLWRLMTERLGYRQFTVAGGDGGSVVAQILALEHPEAVRGVHLTDLGWHAFSIDRAAASRAERKFLDGAQKRQMADGAYALVQMAEPRTLAPALADSPVGLASWIVDRFQAWSECGADLDRSFSKDDLLTNIMIYWATRTIGSSIANYHAEAQAPSLTAADRVEVPVAMALFPREPAGVPPRSLAERTLNIQRWTEMPRGGHFGPLEEPALYADDVLAFLRMLQDEPGRPAPEAPRSLGAPERTEGVSAHV